jgi:molecular chaperone DnaK
MGGTLGKFYALTSGWLKARNNPAEPAAAPLPAAAPNAASRMRAVGIDLGTTISAAAYISDSGQSTMVRNAEGEILTPSVVLFAPNKIVVGKKARESAGRLPDAVADYAKRDMGNKTYSRPILGKRLPPEVIQAYILKQLKRDVDSQLGERYGVVITVPAYFDEPRRQATADAAEIAGLNVLDIVNEPTAAALAFGEHLGYLGSSGKPRETLTVLIYDLGGGTFDVTLIELKPEGIFSLATDGDVRLGGRDWDGRIVKWLAERFIDEHAVDPRKNAGMLADLYSIAETAKRALSVRPTANIRVAYEGRELNVEITRSTFEELTADLLERTAFTTRQLLAAAKRAWNSIDRILLVGGSTRMPMINAMLEEQSSITPERSVNPDEAVARGAAIYAQSLLTEEKNQSKIQIVSVSSHSLGVEGTNLQTDRREHAVLIPRNTPLPAQCSRRCVTSKSAQRSVVVTVLEGDSSDPANCILIGRAILLDLPRDLPKGQPVDLTYHYSRSGRLQVHARVPGTDRALNVEFQRERNYSSGTILRWRETVRSGNGADGFDALVNDAQFDSMNLI